MIIDKPMNTQKPTSNFFGNVGKVAIALTILAAGMAFTNPPRDKYLTYASGKLETELESTVCKDSRIPKALTGVTDTLIGSCKNLLTSQRSTIEQLLDNTTQRENLGVVSIYTTEVGKKSYQTVGVFGNFVSLPPATNSAQN
ncbi:MAG: DUF4359 domain-containing protein [Oscillatoriales cyanobacterium]|nr:MAG: DUF4359 domain-containing protein [Oscillatoriales cyanobacterium]TAD95158.1 MAG: DUF4359 domain-containing protein [Oscillatoriales cyanobacterium]TAE03024.1 MAG: DUF4359 domain-containing protein [Oscillatoriales cyanobacterium]TAF00449.1 MAG: DUF4359 domain-containing protein [Oscillatoriales cyanobacterium]TAF70452.1 MAG: DUF4359 domain-containing protein [Oscillatoriales cyanobacterium]